MRRGKPPSRPASWPATAVAERTSRSFPRAGWRLSVPTSDQLPADHGAGNCRERYPGVRGQSAAEQREGREEMGELRQGIDRRNGPAEVSLGDY